jgi:hypothetical protein
MKPKLYLETTIVSYLVAKPSRDTVTAGFQAATREWWHRRLKDFEVFVSDVVLVEAAAGDTGYARKRLGALAAFPVLRPTARSQALAQALVDSSVLPVKASGDAAHIALAAAHRIHFLLTWNCRHIANAEILRHVERVCRAHHLECPVVCTPHELMGG